MEQEKSLGFPARAKDKHLVPGSKGLATDPFSAYLADKNILDVLRALDQRHLFYPLEEAYRYTRYYEQGLCVAESLLATCEQLREFISADEWNRWIPQLTRLQLTMLDYLNAWDEYIQCYEQLESDFAEGRLEGQWRMVLYTHRYELIKRKRKKQVAGARLGNQLRHQQDALSQDEIDERFERMIDLLNHAALTQNGNIWL